MENNEHTARGGEAENGQLVIKNPDGTESSISEDSLRNTNKTVLRETIIDYDSGRTLSSVRKQDAGSKAQSVDPLYSLGLKGETIEPPLDLSVLAMLKESSTELGQCVDAMVTNVSGFGGRLVPRKMSQEAYNKSEAEAEREDLEAFIGNINCDDCLVDLRKKRREDFELTGNGYWELIPSRLNREKIVAINHIEAHTMRVCSQQSDPLEIKRNYVDSQTGKVRVKRFVKKFRKFVQVRNGKCVWFKEYKDPRVLDYTTGTYYQDAKEAKAAGVAESNFANEIMHSRVYTARSPYGLPRYTGALISIFGSRKADEINFKTFSNNLVPNTIICVSGNSMLTQGSINRIKTFWDSAVKKDANMSKLLILEAESMQEGMPNSGQSKIEIKPMKDNQHDDALFQNYDKNNADKIRRAFRLPRIYVGGSEDYNRATAEASKRLAEEQVFSPERDKEDRDFSQMLLDMGYKYWVYKSYSPNVTDSKDLVNVLSNTEKTGALTPNLAREVLSEILNREIDSYEDGLNGDVPFSLTMAEAVKAINPEKDSNLGGNERTGVVAPGQDQVEGKKSDSSDQIEKEVDQFGSWIDKLEGYLDGKTGFTPKGEGTV